MSWRVGESCCWALLARGPFCRAVHLTGRHGLSLVELSMALTLLLMLGALAVPLLLTNREEGQVRAAARFMAARAMFARSEAARLGAAVGLKFESRPNGYYFTTYVDRDDDGVRSDDIERGVDQVLQPSQRLADHFTSVRFVLAPNVPPVDGQGPAGAGFDPIRLGVGNTLTYSPTGTATSGSLYIGSPSGRQYAVRVLGSTGRLRVLRFNAALGAWEDR